MTASSSVEIMAPAGSFESLAAALKGGADSVYFGVGALNMRSRATVNFTEEDLPEIALRCRKAGAKSYLTLNIIVYDEEIELVRSLCDAAKCAGIDAVIASDLAVICYAHSIGLLVHISVQANVCNIETVRFYAQYAEVVVLARELKLSQITSIVQRIREEGIRGSRGEPMRVEIFAHGALCVAVSGKCQMSLAAYNSSANRGACFQNCRRAYRVIDEETGYEMLIDNKYVMSPKDICTIGVLDQIVDAGVSVLKLEGRGRSSDYVYTVTSVYREAATACENATYGQGKVEQWQARLSGVFNRGFWQGGYYLGTEWEAWSGTSSNKATFHKVHLGKVTNWFGKTGVAELSLEAGGFVSNARLLITGSTTGAVEVSPDTIKKESEEGEMLDIPEAVKGDIVYIKVPDKVRRNDKVYFMRPRTLND